MIPGGSGESKFLVRNRDRVESSDRTEPSRVHGTVPEDEAGVYDGMGAECDTTQPLRYH
jgi:hypothetical protein